MANAYQGSCLCAAVVFEVDEFGSQAGHCHCSMCRKFHGAEYATIVGVPRSSFRWLSEQDTLKEYLAPNGTIRTFCKQCGSSLFFSSPRADPDVIEIALGVFDGPVPVVPDAHIFMDSAANWTLGRDGLPHFAEGRTSTRLNAQTPPEHPLSRDSENK
jgi:hypothetical protein